MDMRTIDKKTQRTLLLKSIVRRLLPSEEVMVAGLRYHVHPRYNSTERFMWAEHLTPEPASIAALCKVVAERPCFVLDVGANCGVFTVPLAHSAAPGSIIRALEPNPEMAGRLRRNLGLNGLGDRVDVLEVAMAEDEGEASLVLHKSNLGQSSLGKVARPGEALTVSTLPYSKLTGGVDPDMPIVMKIDIEGYEDRALKPVLYGSDLRLPDVLLMETLHNGDWTYDVPGRLLESGYEALFEGEGNSLLARGAATHDVTRLLAGTVKRWRRGAGAHATI